MISSPFDATKVARGLVNAQRFDLDKYACSRGSRVEVAYEALCESIATALTDAYQRGRQQAFETSEIYLNEYAKFLHDNAVEMTRTGVRLENVIAVVGVLRDRAKAIRALAEPPKDKPK